MESSWLTAAEAARQLGIKVSSLYAYVSRGVLTRHRVAGRRGSCFAEDEVLSLARKRRQRRAPAAAEPALQTALTLIREDGVFLRGKDICQLAASHSYEQVVEWLWSGERRWLDAARVPDWRSTPAQLDVVASAQRSLPEATGNPDRLRVTVTTSALTDPFRHDLQAANVRTAGRSLICAMVEGLPSVHRKTVKPSSRRQRYARVAASLWPKLTDKPATVELLNILNAVLVLLSDHELATSTFAVRVAASTRADPYSAVLAGLGTVAGSLHGGAGPRATELLGRIGRPAEVVPVLADYLKHETRVPGFGHAVYTGGDPRAVVLLDMLRRLKLSRALARRLDTAEHVIEVVSSRFGVLPNIDFALATFCDIAHMPPSAAETIFSVARSGGWIAHALEEYGEQPLRFRIRADYRGVPPEA
ncbi:MAG: citrate/2-methylcitrate synthase [Pseudomonadota bacterium]